MEWMLGGRGVDVEWTLCGHRVDMDWTWNGHRVDMQWTLCGLGVDTEWTLGGRGADTEWMWSGRWVDTAWTWSGPGVDASWTPGPEFGIRPAPSTNVPTSPDSPLPSGCGIPSLRRALWKSDSRDPSPGPSVPLAPPVTGHVGLYTLTSPGCALVPQKMPQGKSRTKSNISHSKLAQRHHAALSDGVVQWCLCQHQVGNIFGNIEKLRGPTPPPHPPTSVKASGVSWHRHHKDGDCLLRAAVCQASRMEPGVWSDSVDGWVDTDLLGVPGTGGAQRNRPLPAPTPSNKACCAPGMCRVPGPGSVPKGRKCPISSLDHQLLEADAKMGLDVISRGAPGSTDAFEAISTPGEDLPSQTKLQPGPQEPGPDWALTWKVGQMPSSVASPDEYLPTRCQNLPPLSPQPHRPLATVPICVSSVSFSYRVTPAHSGHRLPAFSTEGLAAGEWATPGPGPLKTADSYPVEPNPSPPPLNYPGGQGFRAGSQEVELLSVGSRLDHRGEFRERDSGQA
ncbi:hypothetical protein M91_16657 [Bos mutus]|uniref:Uncharacterized protein n=1 Tax=Bos mutus TaxID=72004 RepID=L8IMJ8_9CETA|nr:hypothetical protein M91_16657 [Bos mutus]